MMEASPIPQEDERALAPESAQELGQMMENMEKIEAYLRERGVALELEKDENPFAVLWPTRLTDAKSLRELGEQLRGWAARSPGVKRILGLEQLLEGRDPKISRLLS
jgi:hypothetical protein